MSHYPAFPVNGRNTCVILITLENENANDQASSRGWTDRQQDCAMLPNFLIIGAMKAGTSSLCRYLRAHPEVYIPPDKELNFFNEEMNWSRGWSWYESQFEVDRAGVRAYGEGSTSYSKYPRFSHVVEKISAALPKVKLIYVVRDPIERIRSMYVHMICGGLETKSFDEVMSDLEGNHYLDLSLYYFQLSQYLSHFSKDQILVIASEALQHHRPATLKRVFRFLEINDSFHSPVFDKMFHVSSKLRRRKRPLVRRLRNLGFHTRLIGRLPESVRMLYKKATTTRVPKPVVSDEMLERLLKVIRPDVEKLRNLVGESFEYWSI